MIQIVNTLSVIGTAGRKDDYSKLSLEKYNEMYRIASRTIDYINESSSIKLTHLISGGAAWADHLAVRLFLDNKVSKIKLYLPCDFKDGKYYDDMDEFGRTADTANYYHERFEEKTGINSFMEIEEVLKFNGKTSDIKIIYGFKNRNSYVAKSDNLLAMTFGDRHQVKDGGTADTVQKYKEWVLEQNISDNSFHYDLNSEKIFKNCIIA